MSCEWSITFRNLSLLLLDILCPFLSQNIIISHPHIKFDWSVNSWINSHVTDFAKERRILLENIGPELHSVFEDHKIEVELPLDCTIGNIIQNYNNCRWNWLICIMELMRRNITIHGYSKIICMKYEIATRYRKGASFW